MKVTVDTNKILLEAESFTEEDLLMRMAKQGVELVGFASNFTSCLSVNVKPC